MGNIQTLALWGGPGAGKTTTAVKLAMELAAHKLNTIILLCDYTVPAPQTLQPKISTDGKSLGDLLTLPSISQDDILTHCIPFGDSPYVSLLGYRHSDNAFTYAQYSKERAVDLITLLRHLADIVLIDVSAAFAADVLSATVLENADTVLRLCTCDLKSMSYMASSLPLLADGRFASHKHVKILSAIKPGQDNGEYQNAYGGVSYRLPHVPELEEQFQAARLMDGLCTKAAKKYDAAIRTIALDLLLDNAGDAPTKKKAFFTRKEKAKAVSEGAAETFAEFRKSSKTEENPKKPKRRLFGEKKPEIKESGGVAGLLRKGGKR